MSRRAIWTIILLMSIGLIGTVLIQIYWFRSAIALQESRFNADVFDALNAVEERMAAAEEENTLDILRGLGSTNPLFVKEEFAKFIKESESVRNQLIAGLDAMQDSMVTRLISPMTDEWQKQRTYWEILDNSRRLNPPDIEDRVDPKTLQMILDSELKDRGIDIQKNFGVYSTKTQSFVILNGNYVVDEGTDQEAQAVSVETRNKTLFNSKYQVQLFPDNLEASTGLLKVHFPNKGSWLWSSLIPTLVSTVIFTFLILFCFSYTIYVIFRQKKVSEMKNDFINNMTHEFKTPIATISLAADSMTSPLIVNQADKIKRFAGIIKQENRRMLSQVEKVLQMALIDKRDFQLNLSDVNMHQLINQAVENANLQVQRRGGRILQYLNADHPVVQGDPTHLSNLIHNLLDNANKYSPESPDIAIHTRNIDEGVEIVVEDHGIGMSRDERKQIFEKFYRVPTGNLHDVKGFGLGLSYVKAITDAHHGKIDVKSELGKGSSFMIYFPFHQK